MDPSSLPVPSTGSPPSPSSPVSPSSGSAQSNSPPSPATPPSNDRSPPQALSINLTADTPAPSAPASPSSATPAAGSALPPKRRSEPSLPPPVVVRKTSNASRHVIKKDFPRKSLQATPVTVGPRSLQVDFTLPRDSSDPQPKRGLLNRHAKRHRRALTTRKFSQDMRFNSFNLSDFSRGSITNSGNSISIANFSLPILNNGAGTGTGSGAELEPAEAGSTASLIDPRVIAMSAGMERSRRASSQSVDLTSSSGSYQPSFSSISGPPGASIPPSIPEHSGSSVSFGDDDYETEDEDEFQGSSVRSPNFSAQPMHERSKSRISLSSQEKDASGLVYEVDSYPEDENLDDLAADIEFCFGGSLFHRIPHSRFGKVKTKVIKLHNLLADLDAIGGAATGGRTGLSASVGGAIADASNGLTCLVPTADERSPVNSTGFDKYSMRWQGSKKDASKTMLWLDSETKLVIGQKAGRWSQKQYRTQFAAQSHLCFTILHPSQKSLDVVCENEKAYDKWIRVIRWICKGEEKREGNIKRFMRRKYDAIAALEAIIAKQMAA